ncbi:MAG: energy-coupling factor ABC transporter ATP-binding protein [Candidatus Korarchaeota archaeon]|nr:energy-coupling factor ABC transporter ATP-binding protein [Thermoproteota archaeon]MCR8463105.1 energy-coupling factor ABC transporter ATP-binding protein [Thermoproteota archaeon]MCR8472262.1 energy-coupling factor ABC transporter ATP-binding protein [Thermoproteota archaeon]MCR8473440.1 energy-coupling factor ABC transporter ATP-binding protein [Thermoproteota archaeon]
MIRLEDVWYFHGKSPIIKGISLTLSDSVTYVIGQNASGKTTLLKLMSLIIPPTKGEVLYNGENPWRSGKLLKLRKSIAYVHEKPILLRGTVVDNVALPLILRGIPKNEAAERARDILREFGLENIENKRRKDISSGQAQLVSLCRVFVLDDLEYIFLDEPTSMLDIENRRRVIDFIRRKHTKKVIATRDLALPLQLPGRVMLIDAGELRGNITLEEYRTRFLSYIY